MAIETGPEGPSVATLPPLQAEPEVPLKRAKLDPEPEPATPTPALANAEEPAQAKPTPLSKKAKKAQQNRRPNRQRVPSTQSDTEADPNKPGRLPKRKVALMMGFCGTGYQGMQVNPGSKTIEGDLYQALVAAGAVSQDNANDVKKVNFVRAARTDKGVHAAGQVVSLKMIVDLPDIVAKINAALPDQIRVWGFVRSLKSFNARFACDSRIYEYMLPTYVFAPPRPKPDLSSLPEGELPKSTPEELTALRAYRIAPEMVEQVRQALQQYVGTCNYHNFTISKKFSDPSAKRVIRSFTCSAPMLIDGTEWLSLKVHGQSFMMHQIRKMVGLVILLVRGQMPLDLIPQTMKDFKINIPKAPGLGLLLEQTVFEAYSKRAVDLGSNVVSFASYQDQIDAFKQEFIYAQITREEMSAAVFDGWVRHIEAFPEYFPFLSSGGKVIGEDCLSRPRHTSVADPAGSDDEAEAEDDS
ncbi:tRNA pseudouridine synthase 1 [Dimargaris verticillata]|uniref:tRNA pseudouridine synthase 1 n=1 Tax=Dimargaris verticillata TaxID=2761393 RepID=A0A9W8B8B4_9FUNG|nr:tRNA pseudouridine synthase 1 [Dimargaris verticillata]